MFVLRTNVAWRDVPETIGCGGVTGWRRFAGVDRGRGVAAAARDTARGAALCRVARDGRRRSRRFARVGPQRRDHTGPSPVDRGRTGSKHHVIVDRHGTPVAVSLTGGSRHDDRSTDAARRGDPTYSRPSGPAAESAPPVVRRPRIRLRQVPEPASWERDHTDDRPQGCRARLWAREGPLGRRADLRLVASIQAPTNTFRGTSGPVSGSARTRLQHRLFETTGKIILKLSVRTR